MSTHVQVRSAAAGWTSVYICPQPDAPAKRLCDQIAARWLKGGTFAAEDIRVVTDAQLADEPPAPAGPLIAGALATGLSLVMLGATFVAWLAIFATI